MANNDHSFFNTCNLHSLLSYFPSVSYLYILVTLVIAFVFTSSLSAQVQKTQENSKSQEDFKEGLGKIFSSANETAIFDNGKVSFLKIPITDQGEKLLTFIYAEDAKSFTMTDEKGVNLQVFLGNDKRIESIIMPNGKRAVWLIRQHCLN